MSWLNTSLKCRFFTCCDNFKMRICEFQNAKSILCTHIFKGTNYLTKLYTNKHHLWLRWILTNHGSCIDPMDQTRLLDTKTSQWFKIRSFSSTIDDLLWLKRRSDISYFANKWEPSPIFFRLDQYCSNGLHFSIDSKFSIAEGAPQFSISSRLTEYQYECFFKAQPFKQWLLTNAFTKMTDNLDRWFPTFFLFSL